ncbi:MAG: hypothetical protein ACXWBL_12360 [Usitatibacter sp.]
MNPAARLLSLAAVAAILPAGAVVQHAADLDDFGRIAASSMDSVGRFDERVVLDWWRPRRKEGFGFYGKALGEFERVDCEQVQEFHIVANANDQAQFNIGACKRDAAHVRDLAVAAEKASSGVIEEVFKAAPPQDRAKVDRMIAYRKVALRGGMTGYSFTLILVGHGIVLVNEAVVYDPSRQIAFIVLGNVGLLCGHSTPEGKGTIETAFCPDTGKALLDVASELARRYVSPGGKAPPR